MKWRNCVGRKLGLKKGFNADFSRYRRNYAVVKERTGQLPIRVGVKVKVKCTLVQALRLCTARTAHRRSRGIAVPFHDHGARWGGWSSPGPGRSLPPGKDPVPIVQEVGCAPEPVWTGAENLASTGIRSLRVEVVWDEIVPQSV